MEHFIHILRRRKIQILFLLYVLLILPLLSPLAQNIPWRESVYMMIINVVLFLCIALFSSFLSPKAEKVVYTLLLIFSMIPGAMLLGYLLFARVLLETYSITSLFETNPEESKEFVMDYFNIWVVAGVLLYIILPVIMILKMKSYRPLTIKKHTILFIVSLIGILCITFISKLSQSVYFINFYNTFVSYKIRLHNEQKAIVARQNMAYEVMTEEGEPRTFVVVIGESLTRNHMQVYGYGRKTTPLLQNRSDSLYIYTDVVSPQVHTIPVIRSVLSFADERHPEFFIEKPSLFEIFNRAGYETYFISNQGFGRKLGTSYDVLLNLAKFKVDLSTQNQQDGIVLFQLENILKSDSLKNKLIVIHLMGNHMAYKFRYPAEFNLFDNSDDGFIKTTGFINSEAKRIIDEYDNSVAYNDYVITRILDILSEKGTKKSSLIYFSDHGEELYDFRKFAGHAYEKISAEMCEVPFIVWLSSAYKEDRTDLQFDVKRPFSTADFLFAISDLAGVDYADYEDRRSLFSSGFSPSQRWVGNIRYEDLKK